LTIRVVGVLRALVLGLLVWLIVGTATIRPFYLAYFNELVGGPRNGYKYLIRDDLDQGQDLKGLSAYLRRHDIRG
jgi:hypothetical protein